MSVTRSDSDPPVPDRGSGGAARRAAPPPRRDALALQGARRRSVAGRAAGDDPGARPLLGDRVRLARVRGEAERAAAVHDRDRRGGHPLHPREVAARGRVAADHDARLARLGHRAARDRRPAHRPDRARRTRRGRVRPRAAVPARLRLLRRAGRARLERRPRRAGLGGADAPPRLHPLRRPGRRRGRRRHRRDGTPGARGAARHPHELARDGAGRPPAGGVRAGTRGGGPARHIQGERLRLLPGDGHAAADDRLRPAGFTRRPGRLAARPRHGQLLQDLPRLRRRRARGQSHPGPHRRQHHAVLADGHRRLGGPVVLGGRTSPGSGTRVRPGSSGGLAPGRLHHLPRRDLADPAQLGRELLPQRHLLQRGRQGRPLRRLGGAGAVRRRDAGCVQAHCARSLRPYVARARRPGERSAPGG